MVQGVGFRPFVYSLAAKFALNGYVTNSPKGVEVLVQGEQQSVDLFCKEIVKNKPPLAKISKIQTKKVATQKLSSFEILQSAQMGDRVALLPPDIAMCDDCKGEMNDLRNRRFGYPLTNCTNCGPRYTIISSLPYDRANTSMNVFEMCGDCQREYSDPLDRRFHAEPISCPNCGPELLLFDGSGAQNSAPNKVEECARYIKDCKIGAIKWLGGYPLVCDASNFQAVELLRTRKRRPRKPLAVMFANIDTLETECKTSPKERALLQGHNAPIALLQKNAGFSLAENLSFESRFLGAFLPYTPLQVLLFKYLDNPIVATSANLSDEPIITDRSELIEALGSVVDFVLDFDREIVNGCDDSVVRTFGRREIFIRTARGFAPKNSSIKECFKAPVLALGAGQKSTVSIGVANSIVTSAHIGDLFGIESVEKYKKTIHNLSTLYDCTPKIAVCDKNSAYESSKYAKSLGIETVELQHHKAHFYAGLYEAGLLQTPALGVIFDGTGLGDDGKVWGGEFFIYDTHNIERVAHLRDFWLLGGEMVAKNPNRSALSILFDIFGESAMELDSMAVKSFGAQELSILYKMYQNGSNSILSSSAGRLFDGVASYFGLIQKDCYDGESGLLIESLYDSRVKGRYDVGIGEVVDFSAVFGSNDSAVVGVSKFLNTLAFAIGELATKYALPVVFSGGVFQNATLCSLCAKELKNRGIKGYFHRAISPNDSNISIGQAVYANLVQNGHINSNLETKW